MKHRELEQKLSALREEMKRAEVTNPEARNILSSLEQRIDFLLDNVHESSGEHYRDILAHINDALLHVRASHPSLAQGFENVIDTANRLGI